MCWIIPPVCACAPPVWGCITQTRGQTLCGPVSASGLAQPRRTFLLPCLSLFRASHENLHTTQNSSIIHAYSLHATQCSSDPPMIAHDHQFMCSLPHSPCFCSRVGPGVCTAQVHRHPHKPSEGGSPASCSYRNAGKAVVWAAWRTHAGGEGCGAHTCPKTPRQMPPLSGAEFSGLGCHI